MLSPSTLGFPTNNENEIQPLESEENCTDDCDSPNYEKPMSNLKVGLILMIVGIVLFMLICLLCPCRGGLSHSDPPKDQGRSEFKKTFNTKNFK